MSAILSRVITRNSAHLPFHPITMFFTSSKEDGIEYGFQTTVENQFGLGRDPINDDTTLNQLINEIEANIGKEHDINLYDFTFSEMTKGRYVSYKNTSYMNPNPDKCTSEFHSATYKSRSDAMFDKISKMCTMCIQGDIVGVKENGEEEKIEDPRNVFFDEPDKYKVTEDMLNSVSTEFIIERADLNIITGGEILVNKEDFPGCRDTFTLTFEIKKYRERKSEVHYINSSLRKKIFFWEKPEPLPQLSIPKRELDLLKTSYLNQTKFPEKCSNEHRKALEKRMNLASGPFSHEAKDFREFLINETKERMKKYKGVHNGQIKVIG